MKRISLLHSKKYFEYEHSCSPVSKISEIFLEQNLVKINQKIVFLNEFHDHMFVFLRNVQVHKNANQAPTSNKSELSTRSR